VEATMQNATAQDVVPPDDVTRASTWWHRTSPPWSIVSRPAWNWSKPHRRNRPYRGRACRDRRAGCRAGWCHAVRCAGKCRARRLQCEPDRSGAILDRKPGHGGAHLARVSHKTSSLMRRTCCSIARVLRREHDN